MYYVYEWFIKGTNEVIYVGKGTNKRYKVRKHNQFFDDIIKRYPCDSRIVKEFDNEADAFAYEYEYINKKKAIGECVCNIHKGGFGGTTEWWTEDLREKYSQYNVMKSENQRKRMREKNPMQNKAVAAKTNAQKRRQVIIGSIEYDSVKSAMSAYGVCYDTIASWCRKGININGEQCRFKDQAQVNFKGKRYNKGGCRPITYKDKSYETPKDLAEELGINVCKIYRWAKNGFDPYGNICRYNDDKRQLSFTIKRKAHHPVIVNNIHYPTISEAARSIGVSSQTLSYYINNKKPNQKYICEYDNQQPSRENTDNSIPEGSTTNR